MNWKMPSQLLCVLALSFSALYSASPVVNAQSNFFYVSCEQGHFNSFKTCEAVTDYVGRKSHQWYGDNGAILDNCGTGRICSVYCQSGATSGAVFVNFINRDTGQLLGTASTSIGCIQ